MTLRPWEKWWRVGGVAGITCVVLSLVPLVLGADEPRFTDSGNDIMAWYVHNGDRWLAGSDRAHRVPGRASSQPGTAGAGPASDRVELPVLSG